MVQIAYIFGSGRERKIHSNSEYSTDFLYGYDYFDKKNYPIQYIVPTINQNFFLTLTEKVFRKISNLPFYFSSYISFKNIKTLFASKVLVLTNDPIALSLLPVLVFYRLFRRGEIIVIVMGLLSKPKPNNVIKVVQSLFIKLLFTISHKFIFLGKKEKIQADSEYQKYKNKFFYLPFCIDSEFWRKEDVEKTYDLIFVGNDGNRDYKFLVELIKELSNLKILVISNNLDLKNFFSNNNFDNVNFKEGSLGESKITDAELRTLYSKSKLSLVPLKETVQPSGQSVSLQSLSVGLPVLISEISGNWFHGENIDEQFLQIMQLNKTDLWINKINSILDDSITYEKDSKNIEEFISKNLNKQRFDNLLHSIIFDEISQY